MAEASSLTTVNNKDFIEKNISNVKTHFKSYYADQATLKVLTNVGEHPFVLKLAHLNAADLIITLQVHATHDLKRSVLIVSGNKQNKHDNGQLDELRQSLLDVLNDETRHNYSDTLFVEMFTKAFEFIDDKFTASTQIKSKPNGGKKKSKSGRRSGSDEENEKSPAKLCSMKTAGDVVHRIQWDTEINQEYVIVGYLDRFLGLKECLFSTFDWGDIVLADLGALAIPEHRINHFKYKGETVWDKNTRLDNVFGSTGSNITMYDVIERLDNVRYVPELEAKEEVNRLGRAKTSTQTVSKNDYSRVQSDEPNYFISIPINNAAVKENLEKFIAELVESNADVVSNFLVPSPSLHLTLCTLRIDNSNELALVRNAMESFELNDELTADLSQVGFKFQGIGEFYDKVVFVKCDIERADVLRKLRETLLSKIKNSGVSTAGNYYDFVPHLTVLKISQSSVRLLNNSSGLANSKSLNVSDLVSGEVLAKYGEFKFGEQRLECVDLCKMVNIFSFKTYPVEFTVKFE
jgi:2'-5' RNA ligase/uncharacterized protein (UPF0248 family)